MSLKHLAFVALLSSNFSKKIRDDLSADLEVRYVQPTGVFSSKNAKKGYSALQVRCKDDEDVQVPLSRTKSMITAAEFSVVMACATNFIQISKIVERTWITPGSRIHCRDVIFKNLHRVNHNVKRRCEAILTEKFTLKVDTQSETCFFRATPRCFVIVKSDSRSVLRVAFYYGQVYTFALPVFDRTPSLMWTEDGRYLVFLPSRVTFDLAKLERVKVPPTEEIDNVHPAFFVSACGVDSLFTENEPSYERPVYVFRAMIRPLMSVIISDPKMNRAMGWDLSIKKSRL